MRRRLRRSSCQPPNRQRPRRIPWRCRRLASVAQYGPHTRQKLAKAERLGDVVIGAELEPDHPVDLVASLIGDDDHRDIGARPDLAQQVEPVSWPSRSSRIAKSGSSMANCRATSSRPAAETKTRML